MSGEVEIESSILYMLIYYSTKVDDPGRVHLVAMEPVYNGHALGPQKVAVIKR